LKKKEKELLDENPESWKYEVIGRGQEVCDKGKRWSVLVEVKRKRVFC